MWGQVEGKGCICLRVSLCCWSVAPASLPLCSFCSDFALTSCMKKKKNCAKKDIARQLLFVVFFFRAAWSLRLKSKTASPGKNRLHSCGSNVKSAHVSWICLREFWHCHNFVRNNVRNSFRSSTSSICESKQTPAHLSQQNAKIGWRVERSKRAECRTSREMVREHGGGGGCDLAARGSEAASPLADVMRRAARTGSRGSLPQLHASLLKGFANFAKRWPPSRASCFPLIFIIFLESPTSKNSELAVSSWEKSFSYGMCAIKTLRAIKGAKTIVASISHSRGFDEPCFSMNN